MRVFCDMDGCLAEFRHGVPIEEIYKKGYFRSLKANENIVNAIKTLCREGADVYLLSAVLDNDYALSEKEEWMDENLPEITRDKRLYPICGSDKTSVIPGGVHETDVLIDDYAVNCYQWMDKNGHVIKVSKNDADQKEESSRWERCISPDSKPEEIVKMVRRSKWQSSH